MAEVKGLSAVEAVLFASGKSMEEAHIKELTGLKPKETRTALEALQEEYSKRNTALFIWNEDTRWKINVKEAHIGLVKTLAAETELARPILETLAVIAFRSPVLQSEIIHTRGDGAYTHISELVDRGFITKEKFARSYKLKVADKFYHYFDVEGHDDIRKALADAKQPDIEKYLKKAQEQKKLGELEVVDALDDAAMEKLHKETQLEIYNIEQQRKDDKENYLNEFEHRLGETTQRINEAEKEIVEQTKKTQEENVFSDEEGTQEKEEKPTEEVNLDDPETLVKNIDEQIDELTKKEE